MQEELRRLPSMLFIRDLFCFRDLVPDLDHVVVLDTVFTVCIILPLFLFFNIWPGICYVVHVGLKLKEI